MGTEVPANQKPDVPEELSEADRRKKEIDDWLPITSSRNAKWWYSAFHNVTAMVGAGVLSLPYAMANLGWGPGTVILVLSWTITLYTLWQMVEMHEMVPGKRFDRYHELGQHAFGEKLGLYIVVPQQLICEVGVDIVYMVTGGKSLQKIHNLVCKDCAPIKLTYFIMIFASVHFVLSHLPNFNSISGVSLAAAVMSLSYSTIAWSASVHKGVQPDVDYGYKASTTSGTVFDFFSALGDVAFAYAGHNVVLEIQATIPSKPGKPSKGPMWKGVVVAYIVVAFCYFPVALIGYYMFGNKVEDNILISLEKPTWLIVAANMFVVIHVIGSYQIYAIPVFDMLETLLVKKLHFRPSRKLRFVTRNIYVAFTMFVGICFPFFGGLLGFFGGFAFAPTVKGYSSVPIYNILMEALLTIGEMKRALSLFGEMKDLNKPDSTTFSIAIICFVEDGNIQEACVSHNKIVEMFCVPSVAAYCSLAKGLCDNGEIDAAMMLVRDCLASVESGPMEFKYSLTILHACKTGGAEKVIDVLNEMMQEGCTPNEVIYSAIISGMCKHGTIEEARKVFTDLRQRKILTEAKTIVFDEILIEHMKKKTADLVLAGLKFFGLESKLKAMGSTLLGS